MPSTIIFSNVWATVTCRARRSTISDGASSVCSRFCIEQALREVLGSTTALVVAHRPSTVLLADRVAVLADGRIAAVGTHQELLQSCAVYRELMSGEAAPVLEGSPAR